MPFSTRIRHAVIIYGLPIIIVLLTVALLTGLIYFCSSHDEKVTNVAQAFSFAQLCDTQLGATRKSDGYASADEAYRTDVHRFEKVVNQINNMSEVDFAMICGDLIDDTRDWEESTGDFLRVKARFKIPCYCACGNNDVGAKPTPESLKRFRERFGSDYYTFDHKGYRFIVANTQLWKAYVKGESEKHDEWFKAELARTKNEDIPVFVIIHYPLFVKNIDEPEYPQNMPVDKRKEVLELCVTHGVKAVLSGHLHFRKVNEYKGVQLVTGEPTSKSFPAFGKPPKTGFNIWDIKPGQRPTHRFFRIKGEE